VPFVPRGRVKYGRRVARFIAISNAVRDAMTRGGVPHDRIQVVFSGVPTPEVTHPRDWRRECGWPDDAVLLGVVGAMTAEKGIGLLTEVAQRLPAAARAKARLVLLGGQSSGKCSIGGLEAYRAGFVDEIHAAMSGLDILLHPSSAEGLGTAVVDAMALGLPPVAFAVGGLVELVQHERNGLLVAAGDATAFADAAARLITDEELRRRLGRLGPVRAAEFDVESMVRGTEEVYGSVLAAQLPAGV
jgi:glycosyltransferase involved in cell wall biosynthesis